jgi:hypothetical protein
MALRACATPIAHRVGFYKNRCNASQETVQKNSPSPTGWAPTNQLQRIANGGEEKQNQ